MSMTLLYSLFSVGQMNDEPTQTQQFMKENQKSTEVQNDEKYGI